MQQRVRFDTELFAGLKHNNRVNKPPILLFSGYRCSLTGVKRLRRDVDHLPPLSVEIRNEQSYTSAPTVCLNCCLLLVHNLRQYSCLTH